MSDDDNKMSNPLGARAAERAWEIRRARMRRILRRFVIVVGVPTLLAVAYYTLWASNEYVSEAVVTVQAPAATGDTLGEGNFVADRAADLELVRQTLRSHATHDELMAATGWRAHYDENGNLFSRLDAGAGSEEAYVYFRDHLRVHKASGAPLHIEVRAFSGEAAAAFATALLEIAEKRINEIALRPLNEQLEIARARAVAAAERLEAARARAPSPAGEGEAQSPELTRAAEALAEAEAAVSRLELARAGQSRYLTVISGPSVPDQPRYPKRLWGIATVAVVSLALMGVFSLLLGAIREHAKV